MRKLLYIINKLKTSLLRQFCVFIKNFHGQVRNSVKKSQKQMFIIQSTLNFWKLFFVTVDLVAVFHIQDAVINLNYLYGINLLGLQENKSQNTKSIN